jgi:hypothetical protein
MFNPIGVSRLTHGSLFVERNLKQKNNNVYVFAAKISYMKEEIYASSTLYSGLHSVDVHLAHTHKYTPLLLLCLRWRATIFDPVGVFRQTHGSLFIARNMKQKNNNIYVFAANRSYIKEEIYASST